MEWQNHGTVQIHFGVKSKFWGIFRIMSALLLVLCHLYDHLSMQLTKLFAGTSIWKKYFKDSRYSWIVLSHDWLTKSQITKSRSQICTNHKFCDFCDLPPKSPTAIQTTPTAHTPHLMTTFEAFKFIMGVGWMQCFINALATSKRQQIGRYQSSVTCLLITLHLHQTTSCVVSTSQVNNEKTRQLQDALLFPQPRSPPHHLATVNVLSRPHFF